MKKVEETAQSSANGWNSAMGLSSLQYRPIFPPHFAQPSGINALRTVIPTLEPPTDPQSEGGFPNVCVRCI